MSALLAACSRLEPGANATDAGSTPTSLETTTSALPETSSTDAMAGAGASTTVVEATVPTTAEVDTTVTTELAGVEVLQPEILNTFPHDTQAFTQGLEFAGDDLIESLGEYGRSARRIVDPATGTIKVEVALPAEQFGNGLTVSDDRLIQLTWQSGRAIVADPDTLEPTGQFEFDGEGWGICAEPDRLITSNGSSRLTFRDPASFAPIGSVDVTFNDQLVSNINELECVDGLVWANRWLTTEILRIDPATGLVTGVVDARSLVPADQTLSQDDVLNGIAYRATTSTFFVTGKRWNTLYEVRFVPAG